MESTQSTVENTAPAPVETQVETTAPVEAQVEATETSASEPVVPAQPTLADLTNGRFESQEQIEKILSEYESLKAKPDFSNDFIKELNNGFASGTLKGIDDALHFMRIQTLDVASMSPEEAIKTQKALETGWDRNKVDDWFEVKFPAIDQDDLEAARKEKARLFELEDAADVAKKAIEAKKVDPKTLQAKPSEPKPDLSVEFNKKVEQTAPLVRKQLEVFREHDIALKDEKAGIDYALKVPVSITKEQSDAVVSVVSRELAANGVDLSSAQGAKTLENAVKNMIQFMEFDRVKETIIRDAFASAREIFTKEVSNTKPPQAGSGNPKPVAPERRSVVRQGGSTFV